MSDERELRLPAWAQRLIADLRGTAAVLASQLDAAEKAAETARAATAPAGSAITYSGPDGETYGLPTVSVVQFGGDLEVEMTGRGVTIDARHRLIIEPVSMNSARIRNETRNERT